MGHADLILHDTPSTSEIRTPLVQIKRAAKRAADLCRQMLAYSGKGKFVVEALDINRAVEETTELLKVALSKKVVLKLELAAGLPCIEADATQIRQVLMNLVSNAAEAIGDRSGVVAVFTGAMPCDDTYLRELALIETLPPALYVTLEVSDTGNGMTPEVQAKMFDPFFTTKFTGRGLGLAAVQGIVKGHKGALKVYSEPGKGTTIKVLLPIANKELVEAYSERSVPEPLEASGIILIADDEETVRALGKRMVERLGFSALLAADGREAIQIYREQAEEIVCVILDLTMPHVNGEEALRELRRIDPNIKIIISSGYNEQEVTSRFVGKGLAGFLQKPYELATLREKLREVL